MIFKPDLVRAIVAGRKTMTRRKVKPDETRSRYSAGRSYAIQPGRGEKAVARILVTDVDKSPVGEITFEHARREGFSTTAEFKVYWLRLYDGSWVEREERDEDALLERFDRRHADRMVWVIGFALDRDPITLLTPAGRPAGTELGYTMNPHHAMPGEPEAIDPGRLDLAWKEWADERHAEAEDRFERARRAARSARKAA